VGASRHRSRIDHNSRGRSASRDIDRAVAGAAWPPRPFEAALNQADVLRIWDGPSLPALLERYPGRAGSRVVRLGLELRAAAAFEADRRRDRRLIAAAWSPVRITWRQLTEESDAVARDLRSMLS
jgi:hypothetical protein